MFTAGNKNIMREIMLWRVFLQNVIQNILVRNCMPWKLDPFEVFMDRAQTFSSCSMTSPRCSSKFQTVLKILYFQFSCLFTDSLHFIKVQNHVNKLPSSISPIFNVEDLFPFRGPFEPPTAHAGVSASSGGCMIRPNPHFHPPRSTNVGKTSSIICPSATPLFATSWSGGGRAWGWDYKFNVQTQWFPEVSHQVERSSNLQCYLGSRWGATLYCPKYPRAVPQSQLHGVEFFSVGRKWWGSHKTQDYSHVHEAWMKEISSYWSLIYFILGSKYVF